MGIAEGRPATLGWAAFLGVPDTRRTLRPISGLPDFLTSPSPLT